MRTFGLTVLLACLVATACVPDPVGRATPPTDGGGTSAAPMSASTPPVDPVPTAPGASPSFVRPTPRPSPTFLVYEVQPGDTLTSIARQFGTTARSIAYWNREAHPTLDPDSPTYEPGLIRIGWMLLLIPTAVVDEDELPDPTPSPTPLPSATPDPGNPA
jgi:hypothetical protein